MNALTITKQRSVVARTLNQQSLETTDITPLRPPLKWAGGKRWQLPHLRPLWQPHSYRRLVEPFAGGLAVALGLQPTSALLNDINPHVINFYLWLRRGVQMDVPMMNLRTRYDRNRQRFNNLVRHELHESSEAAALFYYLNRTGYNGLCRFNQRGEYNVPFGKHKITEYVNDFSDYERVFKRWSFISGDFEKIPIADNDFIYADPPYDVDFTSYSKDRFSWQDQIRLAEWLADHPGPVVLSNQATPRVIRLYRKLGFTLTFLYAPRMISCNGDRTPAREVLAIKNL